MINNDLSYSTSTRHVCAAIRTSDRTPELAVLIGDDAELFALGWRQAAYLVRLVAPLAVPLALTPWIPQAQQLHGARALQGGLRAKAREKESSAGVRRGIRANRKKGTRAGGSESGAGGGAGGKECLFHGGYAVGVAHHEAVGQHSLDRVLVALFNCTHAEQIDLNMNTRTLECETCTADVQKKSLGETHANRAAHQRAAEVRAEEDVEELPRILHFELIKLTQINVFGDASREVLERLADCAAAQRLVRAA